jgi:hypothetical protein
VGYEFGFIPNYPYRTRKSKKIGSVIDKKRHIPIKSAMVIDARRYRRSNKTFLIKTSLHEIIRVSDSNCCTEKFRVEPNLFYN